MDNQLVINHEALQTRDIEIITEEIIGLKNQAKNTFLAYVCEIGKRLCEAKEKLNHGEWGEWLKEKVDFSQSTANNYMNLYSEYGDGSAVLLGLGANSQTFANLDYSKAVKLLAIPSEERESFVIENDIENKSARETDKLIKEHKAALEEKKRLEEENARLSGYQKEASDNMIKALTAQRKLTEKERELEKVKAELEAARNLPSPTGEGGPPPVDEVSTPQISDEELRKIEKEAKREAEQQAEAKFNIKLMGERAKLDEERAKLEAEIAAEKAKKEAAEARAKEANDKIAELEKQAKMSNPFVAEFKLVFEDFQSKADILLSIIATAKRDDPETAAKLRKALDVALSKIS